MAQSWQPHSLRESQEGHQSRSLSIDSEKNYLQNVTRETLENISVCDILKYNNEHNGFLYKRAQEKMTDHVTESVSSVINTGLFSKWQLRYVVLYQEYVLYFKNDRSLRPKGVFSLRGYNRVVRAEDMTSANQQWAFKIIGLRSDDRTWYFGAGSEREMRLWMAFFKVMMEKAIHGKARDRSLRILQDLQYSEKKFIQGNCTTQPSNFEPGIYEDIEEPLDSDGDPEYLPPTPSLSIRAPLPTPPRNEPYLRMDRGPLPTPPPRPDKRESTCSTGSGDYIQPQEVDIEQAEQLRNRFIEQDESRRINTRPTPKKDIPQLPSRELRQGPDGNSFRKKTFVETPHKTDEIQDTRSVLKPVVHLKPKPVLKPKPAVKPTIALKPKPKPAPRDLLPVTAFFNSTDKKTAEGMLLQYSDDGMYILRLSSEQGKVLMVYHKHLHQCKHYKVFGDQVATFSLNTIPVFNDIQQLLQYYIENQLPNTSVKLSKPYPG